MATCMPRHTPGGGDRSSDSGVSARAGSGRTASGTIYLDVGQQQEQILHLITCCRAVGQALYLTGAHAPVQDQHRALGQRD